MTEQHLGRHAFECVAGDFAGSRQPGDVRAPRIGAARRQEFPLPIPWRASVWQSFVVWWSRLSLVSCGPCHLARRTSTGIVRGRVIDAGTNQPLPDVQVEVEATRRRAFTGSDGGFIIVGVPVGSHCVRAARIGFAPTEQVVTVTGGATVDVSFGLERRAIALQDVVTVGYGTQKRAAITGSIATVDADAANVGIVPNVNSMIQGRAAGVNVVTNSGEPGAGAQILIRGGSSISASNEPLYVIDGVPLNNVRDRVGRASEAATTIRCPAAR